MSCEHVHEVLDAYIDNELDVVATLEFERHLTECDVCRITCEQYKELHHSVCAHFPRFEPPKGLENRVRTQLRAAERDQNGVTRGEWFPRWRGWMMMAATAATLLIFSGLIVQTIRNQSASNTLTDQVVSSHIRSLLANHLFDVASSDQHTVKPWFTGKLDFAPPVKDLASEGFSLTGGRLDYLDNRAVAALVYKHRQHTINVFLWPSTDADAGLRSLTIKGFNVVHGTKSHMAYWAVSDLNASELRQFAQDLQK
jgi:anti-sigma factor RsiW